MDKHDLAFAAYLQSLKTKTNKNLLIGKNKNILLREMGLIESITEKFRQTIKKRVIQNQSLSRSASHG